MDTNRLNKALEDTFDDTMIDYESLPHVQYERDQIERQIRELTLHHPEAADDITDIKDRLIFYFSNYAMEAYIRGIKLGLSNPEDLNY